MTSHARLLFSEAHLHHNLGVLQRQARGAEVMAMIKADAYGHGLLDVATRLPGVRLGVATMGEAVYLRQAGLSNSIMVMRGACTSEELCVAAELGLTCVFHTFDQLNWLKDLPRRTTLQAWIKVDTGMGRLGFASEEIHAIHAHLKSYSGIQEPIGLLSHLAMAEDSSHPLTRAQSKLFESLAHHWAGPVSLCNSAALLGGATPVYDLVRTGLALYGVSPIPRLLGETWGLKPVMTFDALLLAKRIAQKGTMIGYGGTYTCPDAMPVGIVGVGYGDGYPRTAQTGTPVLIQGVRCPIVGRVSMDMMAVDLRACPDALPGERVVLWGARLPVEEMTAHCAHSAYDLLTGVQARTQHIWHSL